MKATRPGSQPDENCADNEVLDGECPGTEMEPAIPMKEVGLPLLTEGSIRRGIWVLAWPAVLTMSIMNINGLIDTYFIKQLHLSAALAAVVLSNNIGWVVMSVVSSVNVGSTALVARFTGARSEPEVHETVVQSFTLAAMAAALVMLAAYFGLRPLVSQMSHDPVVRPLAMGYLTITFSVALAWFVFLTGTSIFRGLGNTVTPLVISVVTAVMKVAWDYLLIFGIGPFPKLGVIGAGYATAISQVTGMVLVVVLLLRSPIGAAFRGSWRPKTEWMLRILRIGSPAAMQNLLRSVGSWVFFWILGQAAFATQTQAALGVGLQLEGLAFMPGLGFNIAAATLVGQNLGARKPDRAEKSAWGSAGLGVVMMGLIALGFFIFADPLAGLLSPDEKVREFAALYLRINAISEPFLALSMVLAGAFEGAGDTLPPTLLTVFTLWAIRLPAAYLLTLTFGYGATGAWIAMSATATLQGILIALAFKRGKWKTKKV